MASYLDKNGKVDVSNPDINPVTLMPWGAAPYSLVHETKATDNQVGGTHYNKLKLQPLQLSYLLCASPCFNKVTKYITREKNDPMVNLDKAMHCIELEGELTDSRQPYGFSIQSSNARLLDPEVVRGHIGDFSNQFKNSETIQSILGNMYYMSLTKAKEELTKLKELINESNI